MLIVASTVNVTGANYISYDFATKKNWTKITLTGEFIAQGGKGNDIRVLVMTMGDYINYSNGHQATFLYDSGQLTTSKFNIALPSADEKYSLVFDNNFSFVSAKKVDATVNLNYQ